MSYQTDISGVKFSNCIFNASGPLCESLKELEIIGKSKSAAITTKSCTLEERGGNPRPRYKDIQFGSINSMGLPNLGYKKYLDFVPRLKEFDKPVVISVSGLSLEDNLAMIESFNNSDADLIELNLSCPNIVGKPQIGYDFEQMDEVLSKVMAICKKPLGVKLPPYFDFVHFEQVANILNKHKVKFVSCINSVGNTLFIDPDNEEVVIKPKGGFGGLGGKYVKPIALANVRKFYELLDKDINIIGVGGISSGKDVFEFILAGASAVQLATIFMQEKESCFDRIEKEFNEYMSSKGYSSINEVKGKLKEFNKMDKIRIDPHVHFRDADQNYKETIAHGFSVANEAGVSYVFDMPNLLKPILREEDVITRLKLVPEDKKCNYFLYIGATSDEDQLKEAIRLVRDRREVIGMKMYAGRSTGNLAIINEEEQRKVYRILSENGYKGVIVVHCEKESYMKNIFDPQNPHTHALSRPKIAEIESLKDQIKFAKEYNFKGTLHVAHISCAESIEMVNENKKEMNITCGITPHHVIWSDEKLKGPHGNLYKMNPPLRDEEEVKKLQELLKQGKVDWIETDHAPHTVGEKLHSGFPSGYPTLHIYKEFIEKFLPSLGISEEQIDKLTFDNIINAFGLRL